MPRDQGADMALQEQLWKAGHTGSAIGCWYDARTARCVDGAILRGACQAHCANNARRGLAKPSDRTGYVPQEEW